MSIFVLNELINSKKLIQRINNHGSATVLRFDSLTWIRHHFMCSSMRAIPSRKSMSNGLSFDTYLLTLFILFRCDFLFSVSPKHGFFWSSVHLRTVNLPLVWSLRKGTNMIWHYIYPSNGSKLLWKSMLIELDFTEL